METHLVFFEGLLVEVEKGVCTKYTAESEMKPLFGRFSFSFSFSFAHVAFLLVLLFSRTLISSIFC